MKSTFGKIFLWILIISAGTIAFLASFKNSVETASIAETDAGTILRVFVLNEKNPQKNEALRLKISQVSAKKNAAGTPTEIPFPRPFSAILTDGNGKIFAHLEEPNSEGIVPEISSFPRDEKFLHVGFPNIKTNGKPTSLMFENPFAD